MSLNILISFIPSVGQAGPCSRTVPSRFHFFTYCVSTKIWRPSLCILNIVFASFGWILHDILGFMSHLIQGQFH